MKPQAQIKKGISGRVTIILSDVYKLIGIQKMERAL